MPFSVYLLRSIKAPLRTYVGVSNDVEARLLAHNGQTGRGAAATRAQRPWELYAVVSGFGSEHSALCFEFAWHYPKKVGYGQRHVFLVKSMKASYAALRRHTKEWTRGVDGVEWHLRVLQVMLELDLWKGMSLRVHYPLGELAAVPARAPGAALRDALCAADGGGSVGGGAAGAVCAPIVVGRRRAGVAFGGGRGRAVASGGRAVARGGRAVASRGHGKPGMRGGVRGARSGQLGGDNAGSADSESCVTVDEEDDGTLSVSSGSVMIIS